MKNSELATAFVDGATSGVGSHMYIVGNVIYSYGSHFPIAIRKGRLGKTTTFEYLINSDKYSRSTSRHQSYVLNAIGNAPTISYPTIELRAHIELGQPLLTPEEVPF